MASWVEPGGACAGTPGAAADRVELLERSGHALTLVYAARDANYNNAVALRHFLVEDR